MSQFIRAIEIDQTPNKLLFEYGSELAQQANLESQRQMALFKMKQEQDRDLSSKYGELVKMSFEQMKPLTEEQSNKAMELVKSGLASALNESKGDPNTFYRLGIDKAVSEVVAYKGSREKIANAATSRIAELAPAGVRKDAIENFAKSYMLDPSTANGFSVEKFYADMDKEIADNPQLYMDKEKLRQAVSDRLNEKGVEVERGVEYDPTGTKKLTANIKVPMKPWESLGKLKMPNGIEVDAPKITTETINGMNVITEDSYRKFINNNPLIKTSVIMSAKETIHDLNNKAGVNTAVMNSSEFEAAKAKNPNLIDPFNNGNIEVYAKDAVTKMLKGSYDDAGFSSQGKQAYGSIKDNPPRTTFNVNTGTGANAPVIDQYKVYSDAIATGVQVKKGNKVLGTPLNLLPSGQDYLIETANKVGKKDELSGQAAYDQTNLILTKSKDKIELRKWDTKTQTVGDVVSIISKTPTNVKANQPLGTKSKQKAVAQTNQPSLAEQMKAAANKK